MCKKLDCNLLVKPCVSYGIGIAFVPTSVTRQRFKSGIKFSAKKYVVTNLPAENV